LFFSIICAKHAAEYMLCGGDVEKQRRCNEKTLILESI
jgi:hypothetical protein